MKTYEDKIKAHPVVRELMEVAKDLGYASSARLTGGAVVDILDGREPKDYDISWGACPSINDYCMDIESSRVSTTLQFSTFIIKALHLTYSSLPIPKHSTSFITANNT